MAISIINKFEKLGCMKKLILVAYFYLPILLFGQQTLFEIKGVIKGESKKKIYLFFENDVAHKDSISAVISTNRFSLKAKAKLPILCRLHFGQNTNIQELYIDSKSTYLEIGSSLTEKDTPDSLGGARTKFNIIKVTGSLMQNKVQEFRKWKTWLDSTEKKPERNNSLLYEKIYGIVKKKPNEKISAYLIAGQGYLFGRGFMLANEFPLDYVQVAGLRGLLNKSLTNSYEMKNLDKLLDVIDKEKNRSAGSAFYDAVVKDSSGVTFNTNQYRGKYTLYDFWTTWCGPCRTSNRELQSVYNTYKTKGFEIVSVSLDEDQEMWKEVIKKEKYQWPQYIDDKNFSGKLALYYGIRSVPIKILVDRNGIIIAIPSSDQELIRILNERVFDK